MRCSGCTHVSEGWAPFCPECGESSPGLVRDGALSVIMSDVPSERARAELMSTLADWFPGLDKVKAAERLKSESTELVRGIDEESANRIVSALKAMRIPSRAAEPPSEKTLLQRCWNPGLLISAAAIAAAVVAGPFLAVPLVVGAIAAPVVIALRRPAAREPLVRSRPYRGLEDEWLPIAESYSEVVNRLPRETAQVLKRSAETVFRIQDRLRRESLAAVAAGRDTGELHGKLTEALRAAVQTATRVLSPNRVESDAAGVELERLAETLRQTMERFRAAEEGGAVNAEALHADLLAVADRLDGILGEVRSQSTEQLPRSDKTLL